MARKSVYIPQPVITNRLLKITEAEHRHLVVARTEPGETIDVFDGVGRVWSCSVVEVLKRETTVRVTTEHEVPPPASELILGMAMIQRAAFELALEKVVEAGVTRIIPFVAVRSNVPRLAERPGRWDRIIIEAAKQSKRYHLPRMDEPSTFADVLNVPAVSRILFTEGDGDRFPSTLRTSVIYLIGPEGGWSNEELKSAADAGFRAVSLGAGILRSETAAIAGAFLIRHALGEF